MSKRSRRTPGPKTDAHIAMGFVPRYIYDMASDPPNDLAVRCYSGWRGEQEPRSFRLGGRDIKVARIIESWLSPDHRCFKLLGDDDVVYVLCHDERNDRFSLRAPTKGATGP